MLMERYKLHAETAWSLLVRLSQERNVKIRELAAVMVADPTAAAAYPEKYRTPR